MRHLLCALLTLFVFQHLDAQTGPFYPASMSDGWATNSKLADNAHLEKMDSLVASDAFNSITSVVIAHKGELVFEGYYNGSTEAKLNNTRSVTKTISGALIGLLIQEKKLASVDEKAFPLTGRKGMLHPDPRKAAIDIEDLLTMSSCLECDDWNEFSRGNEERMYLVEDWGQFYWDLPIKGYPNWMKRPEDSPYGRAFSYCTAGVVMLGEIMDQITGDLEAYAEQHLFSQLGIKTYNWDHTGTGVPMTGGGLEMRSRDLLKFGQLYLNQGEWNGNRILPKDWVQESVSPKARIGDDPLTDYGYLWWMQSFAGEKAYYMTGTGGNKVAIFPELDLAVVLTSTFYRGGRRAHNQTKRLLEEFIVPEIKKMGE